MTDPLTARCNRLLAALPDEDLAGLCPHLTPVLLSQGDVLFEPDEHLSHVHFPLSGMVSIIAVMGDGAAVETATTGPEGAVGLIPALGTGRVFWRALVQLPGQALRIERARLRAAVADNAVIGEIVARYTEAMLMQVLQLVACNARHSVEARLARWLITCRNCVGDDRLPITQEFLALMLGVNRTTVTQAARNLQHSRLIVYRRGQMRVLDPVGLERTACECHVRIRRGFDVLLPPRNS